MASPFEGVQKVLKERGLRHVADLGRGEVRASGPLQPPPPLPPQVQVVEKIVYVERSRSVPAPRKARASHLRAVPVTMDLPLFDAPTPSREFPVLDSAPPLIEEPVTEAAPGLVMEVVPENPDSHGLAAEDMERLEELLDELKGLKIRLQAARESL